MANRVAWLTKRVKIGEQSFVRKPIIKTSGFVTEKVVHDGHSVHAPGTFVLEWYEAGKRQRKPLTGSTLEAQDALRKKTQTLEARYCRLARRAAPARSAAEQRRVPRHLCGSGVRKPAQNRSRGNP